MPAAEDEFAFGKTAQSEDPLALVPGVLDDDVSYHDAAPRNARRTLRTQYILRNFREPLQPNFGEPRRGEVRRISLPRTRVNKGKKKGRSVVAPPLLPQSLRVAARGYPLESVLQHKRDFKVDLVALDVAVLDHDVLVLDPSAFYVPQGLVGAGYSLLNGIIKALL